MHLNVFHDFIQSVSHKLKSVALWVNSLSESHSKHAEVDVVYL